MCSKLWLGYIWGAISGCHYLWVDSTQENIPQNGQRPWKYTSENGQCPTECMTAVSVLNKTHDSCQLVQQNIPQGAVSNRIHLTVNRRQCPTNSSQLPACPTKCIGSCQCVQPHCVDSVQIRLTVNSRQCPTNSSVTSVSKIYWQLPVCSTSLRRQRPTEYTWQRTVTCVQQIHQSCQCIQQNILAAASVFNLTA